MGGDVTRFKFPSRREYSSSTSCSSGVSVACALGGEEPVGARVAAEEEVMVICCGGGSVGLAGGDHDCG